MPPVTVTSNVIPIPLGVAGIDTRSDRKAVAPPRLAACENGSFRTPGAIEKRYGTVALPAVQEVFGHSVSTTASTKQRIPTAISDARNVVGFGDRLIMETECDLLSYVPAQEAWHPIGPAPGLSISYDNGAAPHSSYPTETCDMAVADGMIVTVTDSTLGLVHVTVRDADTGQEIARDTPASGTKPRCIAVGDAVLVFWVHGNTELAMCTLTRASVLSWPLAGMAETVITSDFDGATGLYDVAAAPGRAMVAYYNDGGNVAYGYVAPGGGVEGWASETPGAAPEAVCTAVHQDSGRFLVAWRSTADGGLRMFEADGSALFATVTDGGYAMATEQLAAVFADETRAHVFYENTATETYRHTVYHDTVTSAGSYSSALWYRHSGLASKPWVHNGRVYAMLVHESDLQSTYFLARASASTGYGAGVVGRPYTTTHDYAIIARLFPAEALGLVGVPYLPQMASLGDGRFRWPALVADRRGDAALLDHARMVDVIIDHTVCGQWVDVSDRLVGTGGWPWQTDGDVVCEVGFGLYPENTTASTAADSGALTGGATYQYLLSYERTWPDGRREQSTGVPVSVTLGASDDTVTLTIETLSHTNWDANMGLQMAHIAVYRANPGATIFYRVSDTTGQFGGANGTVLNDLTNAYQTFIDRLADEDIEDNEIHYLSSEPTELDHVPPPSCRVITACNNRVAVSGVVDPNLVIVSMLRESAGALTFSDLLGTVADAGMGTIMGLAPLGDDLIVFREQQTYLIGGDGPDNTGSAGEFTPARLLSSDVGCVNARSIVRIPPGLIFHSRKGLYLLGAGGDFAYIGAGVEGELEDETITSAVALTGSHEVRFTLASGKTLAYDYAAQAWSTWTLGGLGACLWQDQWCVLADDTGRVLVETPGTFTDDGAPFPMRICTPWIRLTGMQGYHLFRRLLFLGEYRSEHTPLVRIAYDYEEAWVDEYPWEAASTTVGASTYGSGTPYGTGVYGGETNGLPATNAYQFQAWASSPRAQAIKVEFVDTPVAGGAVLGESYSLSELAVDVALKPGPMRLGAEKTA